MATPAIAVTRSTTRAPAVHATADGTVRRRFRRSGSNSGAIHPSPSMEATSSHSSVVLAHLGSDRRCCRVHHAVGVTAVPLTAVPLTAVPLAAVELAAVPLADAAICVGSRL